MGAETVTPLIQILSLHVALPCPGLIFIQDMGTRQHPELQELMVIAMTGAGDVTGPRARRPDVTIFDEDFSRSQPVVWRVYFALKAVWKSAKSLGIQSIIGFKNRFAIL